MSATVEKEEKTAEPAASDKAKPAKAEAGAKAAAKPAAGAKSEESKKEEVTATVKVLDQEKSDLVREYVLKMYSIVQDSPLYKQAFDKKGKFYYHGYDTIVNLALVIAKATGLTPK